MNVGSLFAGIGGFDLAAERVGMTVEWQSELDTKASAVLDYHWPAVKNLGDIHGITDASAVDVLTGGFPCQDYSVAGKGAGLAGDRGALWWEYLRLITELRPAWVVGENVPGLLSSRGGKDFQTIIKSLTECGYGVAWAVLDAQYFGVAQRRRRVFIVGHSGGDPRPEILALSEGVFGHPEPSRDERTKDSHLITVGAGDGLATMLRAMGKYDKPSDSARLIAYNWQAGAGVGLAISDNQSPNLISNQVPAVGVRRLTPLECERLQGFPDGWTDIPGNSDTQRYRQLGNAVAVPVVEWIFGNIMAAV